MCREGPHKHTPCIRSTAVAAAALTTTLSHDISVCCLPVCLQLLGQPPPAQEQESDSDLDFDF